MKEEKVISFKVSSEIYDKLKESGKSFREILEPFVINLFNDKDRYTPHIPIETPVDYESICKWLDSITEAEK